MTQSGSAQIDETDITNYLVRPWRVTTYVFGALLVGAAIAIWLLMKPATNLDAVDAALHADTVNAADASSAPQQQVVNGWTARDLLAAIAREQERTDQRIPAELALGVIAVAGFGILRVKTG